MDFPCENDTMRASLTMLFEAFICISKIEQHHYIEQCRPLLRDLTGNVANTIIDYCRIYSNVMSQHISTVNSLSFVLWILSHQRDCKENMTISMLWQHFKLFWVQRSTVRNIIHKRKHTINSGADTEHVQCSWLEEDWRLGTYYWTHFFKFFSASFLL